MPALAINVPANGGPGPGARPVVVDCAGRDADEALYDALWEMANAVPVRVVDNGVGRVEARGRVTVHTSWEIEPYRVPHTLTLRGAADVPATDTVEVEREAVHGRCRFVAGSVRLRAVLIAHRDGVATYALEAE